MIKLSSNAISSMISQVNGKGERHIVEVFNVKRKDQSFRFDLKDATTTIKGALFPSSPQLDILKVCNKINNQDRYLIKITEFQVHSKGAKVMIEIHNFTPLIQGTLQNQKTVKLEENSKSAVKKEYKQQETPSFKTEKKQPPNTSNRNQYSAIYRTQPSYGRQQRYEQEDELYDEERLKQFQKISDLYIDFQGRWEIIVRVIDKSYRQFNNKSNKLTKIFSMILVDRTGFKIEGVMFGDDAKEYYQLIKVNQVYRISRGQVREQNFNQARAGDFSKYNIIFNKNSCFVPIKDIPSIPRFIDPDPTLQEIISQGNLDKTYTVAVILLEIGEQRWIQKQNRSIFKKNLLVGDPETKRSVEVVIWNKDLIINPNLVDKTILLKYFRLHSYRDVLSFSSVFKSQIIIKQGHRFNNYQGVYGKQCYEPIGGEQKVEQGKEKHARTIKDLQLELQYNAGQVVYSDLEVWLTHMSFKGKWHYEACNNPKCKKAAESHSKCMFCGHTNQNVQSRYILPIELSDSTGSIWVTAFDQFSNEIFKGYAIHELTKLDEIQLKQVAQCRLYVEYRVRVSSKKDGEGNVKHSIVGKVTQTNIERSSINNLQKIKKALF